MKAFLRTFLASFLAVMLIILILLAILSAQTGRQTKIEDRSYLVLDLRGSITEFDPPSGPMDTLAGGAGESLQRILSNLDKACVDDRIAGVLLKLADNSAGYASMQEIRNGVGKVREAGKPVLVYSDMMDKKSYFLAAACDSIFMSPPGMLTFLGFSATSQHVKGSLDKLGIRPNVHRIRDYKSAAEMVQRENMSAEARENDAWMLRETWGMFVRSLEEDRGLTEERITRLMEHALFTAREASDQGLVDGLLFWDELEDRLKQEDDDKLRTVGQSRYAQEDPSKLGLKGKKTIAVIHAHGTILGRTSRIDPILGVIMGHETVNADFRRARKDDDIAAVILRIDSGGGEALASQLICREVERTVEDKPVIVSMVDVAASGGYEIAFKASKIIADPMTITGSIGSISGKFNLKGLYGKLGITYDSETKGPMALFYSDYRDFTEGEWKRFVANHQAHYDSWIREIAEHRNMTSEEVNRLGEGRVWSGRQAAARGLIDEVGGLDTAVDIAKQLAEIPAEEGVTLVHYPVKKGLLSALFGGDGGLDSAVRRMLYRYIREDLTETWHTLSRRPFAYENIEIR